MPDNQEVFVRDDSDISLIVEVLQLANGEGAGENLENAVRYVGLIAAHSHIDPMLILPSILSFECDRFHFSSLAHDNAASSSTVLETDIPSSQIEPPATPSPARLTGTQMIRKFGKASEPEEQVTIRVALWRLPSKQIDLVLSVNESSKSQDHPQSSSAQAAFQLAASSLQIRDWNLFA